MISTALVNPDRKPNDGISRSLLPTRGLEFAKTHVTFRDNPHRNVTSLSGHTVTQNGAVASLHNNIVKILSDYRRGLDWWLDLLTIYRS
jgi:hypothetical protein